MTTIEEVRERFPRATYAPRVGCKFCDGTGIRTGTDWAPCICIFVSHDMCDFGAASLAETAKKIKRDMGFK